MNAVKKLIDKLCAEKFLSHAEWMQLIGEHTKEDASYAENLARKIAVEKFGINIFFRGIIEFTNICKNDCLYCGIRRSTPCFDRYRLTPDRILECCAEGYENGFRTFVLQGGEDSFFDDKTLCDIVKRISESYPDCAITLSVGEHSAESYQKLYDAGARRYLLRHEAADAGLYSLWHPKNQSHKNRMDCLESLKSIGFQTGCGFMVGAPFQTAGHLATDMEFITSFKPHMIGIGPFIPHKDTPFGKYPAGDAELTLFMISLCRIALPNVLLPATTALGTLEADGRKRGVLCGCNVVMPNLTPKNVRENYMLYDNKIGARMTAAEGVSMLRNQMAEIGYNVVIDIGNHIEFADIKNVKGENTND